MSTSSGNKLFWVELESNENNSEGAGISVTGPYTNSTEDQEILREKLHQRCEADQTAMNALNQLMDAGSDDNYLDQQKIHNAAKILLFTVTTEQGKKDITNDLRPGTESTVKHFYAVRMNEPGRRGLSAEINIGKLDWYPQLGSKLFLVGDPKLMRTYRNQKKAVEHVEKYLEGKGFENDIVYHLHAEKGILIAAIAAKGFMLKRLVTVTKVSVELREDVYDIKGVE